jgi:hypothetical protein
VRGSAILLEECSPGKSEKENLVVPEKSMLGRHKISKHAMAADKL